jgi:hypothetical protein
VFPCAHSFSRISPDIQAWSSDDCVIQMPDSVK